MPWFKVDDQWHDHPKCLGLSFAAKGLWVHAGSWCAAKLTDGFVPRGALRVWGAAPALAAELVRHGLWVETESGWQFHEWTEHQPSKADVVEKRRKIKERVAKHRARNGVTDKLQNADVAECNDVTSALVTLPPSRPVPSRPEEEEELRTPPPRVREDRSDFSVGSDLMLSATGRFYGVEWRPQLVRIGMKPELERRAVLAAIQADPWCQSNFAVDPTHVLKHWPKYAAGNPPLKTVVRANARPRLEMGRVATPEEHAADAANTEWEWPTYSTKP